jgi:hypothetical protein
VAHCDADGCYGAERVWPGGRIKKKKDGTKFGITLDGVLWCGNCGLLSTVSFPGKRNAIMAILGRRPVPETRNWYPNETLETLREENMAHGLDSS